MHILLSKFEIILKKYRFFLTSTWLVFVSGPGPSWWLLYRRQFSAVEKVAFRKRWCTRRRLSTAR